MEMDYEIKGEGNSYTTEFRQYDPRLGRWLSLDPLMQQFPWMSPYVAFDNNPVVYTDPLGLESEGWIKKAGTDDEYKHDASYTSKEQAAAASYDYIEDGTIVENCRLNGGSYGEVYLGYSGDHAHYVPQNTTDLDEFTLTANKSSSPIQSDDQVAGSTPTYDMNNLDFTVNGSDKAELIVTEEMLKTRKKWETFDKGAEAYLYFMFSLPLMGQGSAIGGGLKAALTSGSLNATSNFVGQLAATRDLGSVDYAGVGISFAGGFLKNPWMSLLATSTTDAIVDVNGRGQLGLVGLNKSGERFRNDIFWNALGGVGNSRVGSYGLGLKTSNSIQFSVGATFQYVNGVTDSMIQVKEK